MRLRLTPCDAELHTGAGEGGTLMLGSLAEKREALLSRFAGQVQTIYLDPPFNTGKEFFLRQRCGTDGWTTGRPMLTLPAYSDRWPSDADFLAMLREAVELSHALLCDEGSIFLHIDARMHAHLRLMMDDVFGERNFVNEIIWAYQTGGRSTAHFSRKHDIILFYRKTPAAYFNIQAVGVPRTGARKNHMRRAVDERGRTYRSIISYGKEYRYYDDDPVYPGDVWDDVSHLQQKDPQRTGYDNQKPLKLLERIILCSSRPGDLVCDLFAGSGTTAVAAAKHGRRFLALDTAETALAIARKRLLGCAMRIEAPCGLGAPELSASISPGLGLAEVRLSTYQLEEGLCGLPLPDIQAVDQLSAGYLRGGVFHAMDNLARTKATPALREWLEIPVLEGSPALLTVDVLGRKMAHVMEDLTDGE